MQTMLCPVRAAAPSLSAYLLRSIQIRNLRLRNSIISHPYGEMQSISTPSFNVSTIKQISDPDNIWVTAVAALIWTMGAVPKDPEGFANHTATPNRGTACAGSLAQPELLQRRESRLLNLPAIVHPLRSVHVFSIHARVRAKET